MADAPNCGAEEKIGHSGRDDKSRKSPPRAQPGIIPQKKRGTGRRWLRHMKV